MPKVSVVIPVYNGVGFIKECVDSIASQTLKDIEIIIVDAGSTDGTVELIERYADEDKRIRLLHSEKKSMGYQYNKGISAANGEYIGFCEADDYIADTMLESLYKLASEHEELDYVKSTFDMFIDKENRLFLPYDLLGVSHRNIYGEIINPMDYPDIMRRDVNMWNGIYKTEFIKKNNIKLNETPKAAFQDTGFVLQTFLYAKNVMYVKADSYHYRRDNINSSVYDQQSLIFVVQEFCYYLDYIYINANVPGYADSIVLRRFGDLFGGYYNKLPEQSQFTEEIKTTIDLFRKRWAEVYGRISYRDAVVENMHSSLSFNLLLREQSEYDKFRKDIALMDKKRLRDFCEYIGEYNNVVIFGAGEVGTCTYGLLRKNDYNSVKAFTDNDEKKWGSTLMDIKVLSPKEAVEKYADALFVVANEAYYRDIYLQLKKMGIDDTKICKAVYTIPHATFEIEI